MPRGDLGYCCVPPTVLKWIEIGLMVALTIIAEPFGWWDFYGYIMFVAAFCGIVTAILLLIYFCDLQRSTLACGQWMQAEVIMNVVEAIMNFVIFGLTLYYSFNYGWRWTARSGALAAVSAIAGFCFIASAGVFSRGGYILVV